MLSTIETTLHSLLSFYYEIPNSLCVVFEYEENLNNSRMKFNNDDYNYLICLFSDLPT